MPGPRWDQNCVPRPDQAGRTVDLHVPGAFQQKVQLLTLFMVVPLGGTACGQAGFSQTLILHRRIRPVQDAANLRAILGYEWFLTG